MEAYAEGDASATELLRLFVRPNQPSSYNAEQLGAKLRANTNARLFRAVIGADSRHEEDDFRVRRLLEEINSEHLIFDGYALICSFFTDTGEVKTKGKDSGSFSTIPASRFEKILFVSAICFLSFMKSGRAAKRQKVGRSGSSSDAFPRHSIPSLKSLAAPIPQRVGATIQQVVRAWDVFCEFLGFPNAEAVVLPYLVLTRPQAQFEVLKREDGFARKGMFSGEEMFSGTGTTAREETYPHAFDRPEPIDAHCRSLSSMFMDDVQTLVKTDTLYSLSSDAGWDALAKYKASQGTVGELTDCPPRFHALDSAMIASLKAYTTQLRAPVRPPSPPSDDDDNDNTPAPSFAQQPVRVRQLSQSQRSAELDNFQQLIKKYIRLHNAYFHELLENDEVEGEGSIESKVQLILTDPPYNVRRESGTGDAEYDSLSRAEMKQVVDLVATLLRPGGHALLFCTVQQFVQWQRYFGDHKTSGSSTFNVDKVPLVICKHPSAHNGFPGRASCTLQSSAEFIVHVKRNGLTYAEEERMVNYRQFNYVVSSYPAYKNVLNNVPRLLPREQIRVPNPGNGGTTTKALRPEQKSLDLLKELISRFSQPGDLVVDMFAGTFATALACLQLPKHRCFVGCEPDDGCFQVAFEHTVKRVADVLNTRGATDIPLSEDGAALAKLISGQSPAPPTRDPRWNAPEGMPPYQRFPPHIAAFVSSKSKNRETFLRTSQAPLDKWGEETIGFFHTLDAEEMRTADAAFYGLFLSNSLIRHPQAGLGVFTAKSFQEGDVVCTFYGTLVYHDLYDRVQVTKTYADGIMAVSVERFRDFALQLEVNPSAADFRRLTAVPGGNKLVFIAPAPFCTGGYINDFHYWDGDAEKDSAQPRTANVQFSHTVRPVRRGDALLNPHFVEVRATRLINPGEELLIDYGKEKEYRRTKSKQT